MAGSRLSPRCDQWYKSKGLIMDISLASIQHEIKVIKQNQSYCITGLCAILVAYPRSTSGERWLCIEEQP